MNSVVDNAALRASNLIRLADETLEKNTTTAEATLRLLKADLQEVTDDMDDKAHELLDHIDRMTNEAVILASSEFKCNLEKINQFARVGLRDVVRWLNDSGPAPTLRPFICHVTESVNPRSLNEYKSVLQIHGINLPRDEVYFVLENGPKAGALIGANRPTASYMAHNGERVALNLLRLRNDTLLSCQTTRILFMFGYEQPTTLGETLVVCQQEVRASCIGGIRPVDGRCQQCVTRIADYPARRLSLTTRDPHGGKNMQFLEARCENMKPGANVMVVAGGRVSVTTNDHRFWGDWPKWLIMFMRKQPSQANCHPGTVYDVELPLSHAYHSVNLCDILRVPADGSLSVQLVLDRCKQGDGRSVCTLQEDFRVVFRELE
ncbi:MAG: hypothetical protein AAGC55_00770 [Myxococcota bacterium]